MVYDTRLLWQFWKRSWTRRNICFCAVFFCHNPRRKEPPRPGGGGPEPNPNPHLNRKHNRLRKPRDQPVRDVSRGHQPKQRAQHNLVKIPFVQGRGTPRRRKWKMLIRKTQTIICCVIWLVNEPFGWGLGFGEWIWFGFHKFHLLIAWWLNSITNDNLIMCWLIKYPIKWL